MYCSKYPGGYGAVAISARLRKALLNMKSRKPKYSGEDGREGQNSGTREKQSKGSFHRSERHSFLQILNTNIEFAH